MNENDMSRWSDPEPDESQFAADFRDRLGLGETGKCPDPALLVAGGEQVQRHLEECAICRGLARDLLDAEFAELGEQGLRAIRERLPAEPPRRANRRLWRWAALPLAASVVLAVLYFRRPAPEGSDIAAGPAPVPAAQPLALALTKPPIELPAAALVFRGGDEGPQQELLAAMGAFRKDDYATAAGKLRALAGDPGAEPAVHFYLGVSLLFLDRAEEAVAPLERAKQEGKGWLARESAWYLAIAHQKRGLRGESVREMESLCATEGTHREEACAALRGAARNGQ